MYGHYDYGGCGSQDRLRSAGAVLLWLRSAALVLLVTVLAWPGVAAENMALDAPSAAASVLQRFIVSQGKASGWPLETIEIEASLPSMKKTGRLRAIRRFLGVGHPDYKVLEIAGD